MAEPIFVRTDEGVENTTGWPPEMSATREFVEGADTRWLQRKWRTLSFSVINGSARYRMTSRDRNTNTYALKGIA